LYYNVCRTYEQAQDLATASPACFAACPRWFKEGNLAKKAMKRAVARRAMKRRAVKRAVVKRRLVKKAVKRRAVKRAVVKRAIVKRAIRRAVLAQLLTESGRLKE